MTDPDPEYGPVPEAERDAYHRIRDYAFDPEEGRRSYEAFPKEFGARRGVFVGGDLRAVCSTRTFPTAVRGRELRMGGVAGVAAAPEHRRKGHVRRLLAGILDEYRADGVHLCGLYPFSYEFFGRQGWALAERVRHYACPPSALGFADEDREERPGEFVDADPDDHEALNAAYERAVDGYSLATTRSEAWWREWVFERRRDTPYVYAWRRDGDVRGYVSYTVSESPSAPGEEWTPATDVTQKTRRLDTHEFVAADPEARRHLLRFLYHYAPQVERVSLSTPEPIGLLERARDPRAIEATVAPGAMVRIVDVPAAIEALPFPAAAGEVTLSVSDPLVAANDATFAVRFGNGDGTGDATCERVDVGSGTGVDARLDVGTLSQLAVGFLDPGTAEQHGDLAIERDGARSLLADAFPSTGTYLPEKF
ncbi:MAG: enhanced intracellular survival protein Eis [Haloarculaceae archaeon]